MPADKPSPSRPPAPASKPAGGPGKPAPSRPQTPPPKPGGGKR